jgi:formate hydrogenlyase transcriptional activator
MKSSAPRAEAARPPSPPPGSGVEPGRAERLLKAILDGTSTVTGREFFRSLVQNLAKGLNVRYSFVAECLPNQRARSLAAWFSGRNAPEFEYDLRGTPCWKVIEGQTCHHECDLQRLFPEDKPLAEMAAESYLGVPVRDSTQAVLGHLVIIDDKPMAHDALAVSVMETFANRAGVELERVRAFEQLRELDARREALLNVNRAASRHLERDELFGTLAVCLRTLFETDRFGIELPIEGDRLQGHLLTPNAADTGPVPTRTKVLPRAGTACDWVLQSQKWLVAASREELRADFSLTCEVMEHEGMESLCAMPLVSGGSARGVMFFMAARRGAYARLPQALLEQVATTVAVALDDCLAHEKLKRESQQALAASEERFRDLFDEAPIAYVNEGLDSKFICANRTALKTLGLTPEDVPHTYGKDFIPDTPDAQRRLKEAFESIGKGLDTRGVVLELRRKDNGQPLWIQWWSRPAPDGTYTRTMFVDITERVLMEQEKARLEAQNTYLQEEIRSEHNFGEIVGGSPALLDVLRAVEQVAPSDSTALICGETGTGKELIARAIHDRSGRKSRPLVKVNCGAISAGLVESELFGHVKGAFTGALANRDGRFKVADGGTIFLDEVGELPLETQVKLLRVLQEQEFEPIGSSKTVKVDVRIIAATNRDLGAAVAEGKFRRDLYYRLNVFPITVPPLRERAADVPLLVSLFLQRFAKKFGKSAKVVSAETMRRLASYAWPGNIRELQNVIERAILLSPSDTLMLAPDFGPATTAAVGAEVTRLNSRPASTAEKDQSLLTSAPTNTSSGSLEDVERRHIETVLAQTNWMIEGERGAAKILNLNPSTLRSRMKILGIKRPD